MITVTRTKPNANKNNNIMKGSDLIFFSLEVEKNVICNNQRNQRKSTEEQGTRSRRGTRTEEERHRRRTEENKEPREEAVKLVVSAAAITQMTATDPGSGTQSLSRSQGRPSASRSCHSRPYAPSPRSTLFPHPS